MESRVFLRPGNENIKELLHAASFDSSEDEMPSCRASVVTYKQPAAKGEPSYSALDHRLDKFQDIFQFIGSYKPQKVELPTLLRPFVPNYIPAVGAVDEFVKVPRPDGLPDYLGLKVLDESGPNQSDPAVITLQLRASTTEFNHHLAEVAAIEDPKKDKRKINAWIESMRDLHRLKPLSIVTYSKMMPDMESLMKELPDIEESQLPNLTADTDLETCVDMCCSFLGIPIYKSQIESLHCLFTLYLELKRTLR